MPFIVFLFSKYEYIHSSLMEIVILVTYFALNNSCILQRVITIQM